MSIFTALNQFKGECHEQDKRLHRRRSKEFSQLHHGGQARRQNAFGSVRVVRTKDRARQGKRPQLLLCAFAYHGRYPRARHFARNELKAEKIIPFSEEETDKILKEILVQKSKGVSVRKAVLKLSGGDDKLMLRYQNKYRNIVSKQPERIERLMRECGIKSGTDEARRRIEDEINVLYDRLASSLKEENKRLTTLLKRLTDENALLRLQLKNMSS